MIFILFEKYIVIDTRFIFKIWEKCIKIIDKKKVIDSIKNILITFIKIFFMDIKLQRYDKI